MVAQYEIYQNKDKIMYLHKERVLSRETLYHRDSSEVARDIRSLLHDDLFSVENVYGFYYDIRCGLLGVGCISVGNSNAAPIEMKRIFQVAILCNAHHVIIVHNHPTGDCSPSKEDISLTERVVKAGNLLGISVVDHIVMGKEEAYSTMFHHKIKLKEEFE